jgi:hypothetical protein
MLSMDPIAMNLREADSQQAEAERMACRLALSLCGSEKSSSSKLAE